jgi:ATP-dependent RNA helicase DeaD
MTNLKIVDIYGGQPIGSQISALKKRPQIIVCTPGRLIDHMERRTINLDNIKVIVLDEVDEMFNMGFTRDVERIIGSVKGPHQTLMFSATMNDQITNVSRKFQKNPFFSVYHLKLLDFVQKRQVAISMILRFL